MGNDATLEQDMAKGDNENSRLLIFPQAKHLEFPFKVVLPVSNDTSLTLEKNELFSDIPPPNWVARYDCALMMRL